MTNEIELIPIRTSQQIQAAGYDVPSKTLRVQVRGEIWEYSNVEPRRWERLMGETETDVVFSGIEYDGRKTKKLIPPEPKVELPLAERLVELGLAGDYGPPGSPTRARYEELMRRREALPTARLQPELEAVRAKLAAVTPASSVEEVEHLYLRRAALRRIVASAGPVVNQINAEIAALREEYRRSMAAAAKQKLWEQAQTRQRHARLAELNKLIRAQPPLSHLEFDKLRGGGSTLEQATAQRLANWKIERVGLRTRLGLEVLNREDADPPPRKQWRGGYEAVHHPNSK
ncbi:MAG: KTSC domain-containing protein [Pyrinomonadaceae bacterium]